MPNYKSTILLATLIISNLTGFQNQSGLAHAAAPTLKTAGQWSVTASMAKARYYHTATRLPNGKVLVTGGDGGGGATAELYDPSTATWSSTASMSTARYSHTATLLPNGKVLVAGGDGISTAELYDPSSGTWSSTGSMNTARFYHTATLLPNGKVLVAGSYNPNLSSAELYDPSSGTWSSTGSMSTARYYHTATLLPNGKVLVAGGYNNGTVATAELYDPSSGTWSSTGSMNTARYVHTATLLPNGKVLVAGGGGSCGSGLASSELYDPSTGTWNNTGSLSTTRCIHTATLLPNGKVLVASGWNEGYVASAELYASSTGTWSNTGSLATARYAHTATLLTNGQVLVAGGYNDGAIASAELYDPGAIAPTAVTNAPSVITSTSARFSGTVTPNGATTAASFDWGRTTTYGSNIAATPASIAATAAATAVSANVTGLNLVTTYHYRVKATNSAGTSLGLDKAFTTTAPSGSIQLSNGVAATAQTITANEWKYYYLNVPAGADTLKFVTTGSGDIDLQAQINVLPTDTFACNSEEGGSIETCQPTTTTAGTWWLGVFAYEDSTFNVTGSFREPQTIGAITFNPTTVTAGHTTTASATASSGLAVAFTTTTPDVCSTNGSTVQGLHLGTCTVTANQAGDANYVAATAVSKNITVSKGTQTITVTCDPANITVGTTANCTATATSGLTSTVTAAPSSVCTLSGTTLTGNTVGTCTVKATQAGNADFSAATAEPISLPIAKGNQTITLTCTPLSIAVSGTANCTATASSNLTPSLSVIDPNICTISNGTVTGLVAGFCTVKAKQIGNSNYNAATPVTKNIQVGNVVTYTVTSAAGSGGSVNPDGAQTVTKDTKANFTVTANTGYTTNSAVTGSCPQGSWDVIPTSFRRKPESRQSWTPASAGVTNVWTTGAITANCSVTFGFTLNTYQVTATAGSGGTVTPTTRTVKHGLTTQFTVNPNTDYTINNTVSGTCPSSGGSWNGNVWTTGAITAACAVNFSFTYNPVAVNGTCGSANGGTFTTKPTTNLCNTGTASVVTSTGAAWNWTCNGVNGGSNVSCAANAPYTVTPSAGANGSISPSTPQPVDLGALKSFTVTPNSGYVKDFVVGGTCPQGSWNENNRWTTAPITANCTVNFNFVETPTAWLSPINPYVVVNGKLALDLRIDSFGAVVTSYGFNIQFDQTKLLVNTNFQNTSEQCKNGVCPGADTLNTTNATVDNTTGKINLIGFDTEGGQGPRNDLQLLTINFVTRQTNATTPINLTLTSLLSSVGDNIGNGTTGNSLVTIQRYKCGDANGDTFINIIDALSIARQIIGLPPPPSITPVADVNSNGEISIVDAMHISRYSVGLVVAGTCLM